MIASLFISTTFSDRQSFRQAMVDSKTDRHMSNSSNNENQFYGFLLKFENLEKGGYSK